MKIVFTLLIIFFAGLTGKAQSAPDKKDIIYSDEQVAKISGTAVDVSFVNLIANPEKYSGQIIRVTGYLNLEYEGCAIYFRKDDYENHILINSLCVGFSKYITQKKTILDELNKEFSRKYVTVTGKFEMNGKAVVSTFGGGCITDIVKIKAQ